MQEANKSFPEKIITGSSDLVFRFMLVCIIRLNRHLLVFVLDSSSTCYAPFVQGNSQEGFFISFLAYLAGRLKLVWLPGICSYIGAGDCIYHPPSIGLCPAAALL